MAPYVVWTARLSVHVEKIDNQHKELYARLNRILEAVVKGEGRQEVENFLKFLVDYCVFHFGTEESLMKQYDYPGFAMHKSEHERLTGEVLRMMDHIQAQGVNSTVVVSVVEQMGDWIGDHIGKMDTALGAYLAPRI